MFLESDSRRYEIQN